MPRVGGAVAGAEMDGQAVQAIVENGLALALVREPVGRLALFTGKKVRKTWMDGSEAGRGALAIAFVFGPG